MNSSYNHKKYKVAVLGVEEPQAGGAHFAELTMLAQLIEALPDWDFYMPPQTGDHNMLSKYLKKIFSPILQLASFSTYNVFFWKITMRFPVFRLFSFESKLLKENVDLVLFLGLYDEAIKLSRIPYIVSVWDVGNRDFPSLPEMSADRIYEYREWRVNHLAKKAFAILVDSNETKQKLNSLYDVPLQRIVSLPFNIRNSNKEVFENRSNFALYPGHFWSHKNHVILIEALSVVLQKGGNPRKLVFTGLDKGNKQRIDRAIVEFGVGEYVEYLGFVSKETMRELYISASVTLMPSILGPTNVPPLEALALGCPVVITNAMTEDFYNGTGVMRLDPFDLRAWAEILECKYEFDPVDTKDFFQSQETIYRKNLINLKELFHDFKLLRNLH
jgi:glycosyltransferase involved in cell wall biosynthesis